MSRFSARNFVAPQEADPVVSVKLVRGRFKSGRRSGSGDERGITLQTLIVTAVLVLMAVAAGVIIVAITDNSADDLEDQASDLDGRCQPWEIHDTELEAIGAGGGKEYNGPLVALGSVDATGAGEGGVTSSKIGCLAPCYLRVNRLAPGMASTLRLRPILRTTGLETLSDLQDATYINYVKLEFDTSNRTPMSDEANYDLSEVALEYRLGVTYQRRTTSMGATNAFVDFHRRGTAGTDPSTRFNTRYNFGQRDEANNTGFRRAIGTHVPPVDEGSKIDVRVTAGQDGCIIFNTDTGDILLDSRDS